MRAECSRATSVLAPGRRFVEVSGARLGVSSVSCRVRREEQDGMAERPEGEVEHGSCRVEALSRGEWLSE